VSAPGKKMSLTQATMLVTGDMIGTGVFLLPVNLAQVGSIAIFGWVIATAGVAALGLTFAKLGELSPQQGGPYAYARDFLGPYAGFQTGLTCDCSDAGVVATPGRALPRNNPCAVDAAFPSRKRRSGCDVHQRETQLLLTLHCSERLTALA
jgi:hypothetical protein